MLKALSKEPERRHRREANRFSLPDLPASGELAASSSLWRLTWSENLTRLIRGFAVRGGGGWGEVRGGWGCWRGGGGSFSFSQPELCPGCL